MKILRTCVIIFAAIGALHACNNQAKAKPVAKAKLTVIDSTIIKFQLITNAIASPVQMSIAPDNSARRFITDNSGKIWIMKNDSLLPKPFLDISVKPVQKNQQPVVGTIFSMAFHPQFKTNRKFYVCYNAASEIRTNKSKLVISEFMSDDKNPDITDAKSGHSVFELEGRTVFGNGAEIAFGPDGYLYISIGDDNPGDSSYKSHAQDLSLLNGKILRIDINKTPYAIPPDNPFVGLKNERPEIWAYGFRKVWRFCFDPTSKQLFGADVGEQKEEEIDIITKGGNYGWPSMEGDSVYDKSAFTSKTAFTLPINTYTHQEGICIIGGSFYQGKNIPSLQNKYVFADFNSNMFSLTKNEQGKWLRQQLKIVNKPVHPFMIYGCNADENSELYVMGILNTKNGTTGAIYKIVKE
ncbi:MAG: PQQ-dependent sugar dehydrogenase [Ginsengibacter sp.]